MFEKLHELCPKDRLLLWTNVASHESDPRVLTALEGALTYFSSDQAESVLKKIESATEQIPIRKEWQARVQGHLNQKKRVKHGACD